jgi:hypothetical protein
MGWVKVVRKYLRNSKFLEDVKREPLNGQGLMRSLLWPVVA